MSITSTRPTEAAGAALPATVAIGDVDIALVRWPQERAIRDALAALDRPRLLLVAVGEAPPDALDAAEEWLRWPADHDEVLLRAHHLSQRIPIAERPPLVLEAEGMLRRGDRWVAISEAQLPVVGLLIASLGRVVRFEAIVEAYASLGGSTHPASVRTVLSRIEARVRPLGLEVTSVRRRGVVLRDADVPR